MYTSSISAPAVVCRFLELLDVRPDDHVLDVGTGTGWTSALLASRVGDGNVVTVEVDPKVAARARRNLRNAGWHPDSIVGDGAQGARASAPYDRVHVTCGVARIPYAWVEQTRPGGVIVAPYQPGYGYGHKVRLDVIGDGTAVGRFRGPAGYMMMRSQRPRAGRLASFVHHEDEAAESRTTLDPREVVAGDPGGDLAISALAPGVRGQMGYADDGSGEETLWLLETTARDVSESWALVEYVPGAEEYAVRQYGPRRLWDEVRDAYLRWLAWGRPERERFGLIVTPAGDRIWLDDPVNAAVGASGSPPLRRRTSPDISPPGPGSPGI
jgi:protein-L-isoaspartate(D-aspartate) O-methyltransferase